MKLYIEIGKFALNEKENAINETQKNFKSVKSMKIRVISLYGNKNAVAAELIIAIDDKDELHVVDVITINTKGKISSIKAYVGRGDKQCRMNYTKKMLILKKRVHY